jgi:hypothetical protein
MQSRWADTLRVREVPGSNLDQEICYSNLRFFMVLSHFLKENSGTVP